MAKIIKVKALEKNYGKIIAVDSIDFDVRQGEMFAFLGPNGAGKSTTINILCTILGKKTGDVIIDGLEVGKQDSEIRKRIGVVFQDSVLDNLLTAEENLITRGSFYGLSGVKMKEKVLEVSEAVNIKDLLKRPYGKLSGGQKRRVDIARALLNTPKILFLDEPTTGLDPQTRESVWDNIRKLQREKGMTIFLSTHYMEEAATADNIAIIDNGKIVARGKPENLKVQYSKDHLRIIPRYEKEFLSYVSRKGYSVKQGAGAFTLDIDDSMQGLRILKEVEKLVENFEVVRGSMDEVFINITGKDLRDEEGMR